MGAGILPTAIHNGKIYFLFGKENKYADTPGWSDIGGGTDNNETFLETATREGAEELTGFLGMEKDIKRLLTAHGTYKIDFGEPSRRYRVHIFPMKYDPMLPVYYNNNHRFLERESSPSTSLSTPRYSKRRRSAGSARTNYPRCVASFATTSATSLMTSSPRRATYLDL